MRSYEEEPRDDALWRELTRPSIDFFYFDSAEESTDEQPDRVWTSDVTYVWTQEGRFDLIVFLDLCSRGGAIKYFICHDNQEVAAGITFL